MRLRTLNSRAIPPSAVSAILFLFAGSIPAAAGINNTAGFDELTKQGRAAFLASDLDRAESAYNQACSAELVAAYPVAKVVTCENLLASVDEARGNLTRAEQRYLQAVAGAEQAGPAYQPLYCAKLIDLGEYFHRRGRLADAETNLRKAADLARNLTGVTPALLPEALIRLGGLYPGSVNPEPGRAPLTEALAMVAAAGRDGKSATPLADVAFAHDALGLIEMAAGHYHEAESHLRESAALAATALGEDHPVTATYRTNLALVLLAEHQFERARLLLRRAQVVLEARSGTCAVELAVIYAAMTDVASSEDKVAEAEDYAQRAISLLNRQSRPDAHAIAAAQVTLAAIYLRAHDTASAERILPQAVEIQRQTVTSPNTMAASVQLLGELRVQQRNWTSAAALYREAIGIYERSGPANINPAAAPLMRALADLLKHQGGSKEEVRTLESKARDILRSVQARSATQSAAHA